MTFFGVGRVLPTKGFPPLGLGCKPSSKRRRKTFVENIIGVAIRHPFGATPCSCTDVLFCTDVQAPGAFTRPFSNGTTHCSSLPRCFWLSGMFGVPATLLRVGSGLDGLGGNLGFRV